MVPTAGGSIQNPAEVECPVAIDHIGGEYVVRGICNMHIVGSSSDFIQGRLYGHGTSWRNRTGVKQDLVFIIPDFIADPAYSENIVGYIISENSS